MHDLVSQVAMNSTCHYFQISLSVYLDCNFPPYFSPEIVWLGIERCGIARYDMVWQNMVWCSMVWCWARMAHWYGMVWYGMVGQGWLSAIIVRSLPWSGQVWGVCPAPRALLWLEYTPYNTITRHPTPHIPHNTFQCHIT